MVVAGVVYSADPVVGDPCLSWALIVCVLLIIWFHLSKPEEQAPSIDVVRLRAMDLRGRARLCRDVAVRFLEGAERHTRLAARLRREAEGWRRLMFKEMMEFSDGLGALSNEKK